MDPIQLTHSTGHARIDECLSAVIAIIEAVFPQRMRAYYVLGSYAEHHAVPGSDVDLFVVSKDILRPDEQETYRRVAAQCAILAGLRLDTGVVDEAHLGGRPVFATQRLLLYGEDVSAQIPPLHHGDSVRMAVSAALFVLRELYDVASPLHVPLGYPDPQGAFYGFERTGMPAPRGWSGPGTKKLVNAVSMAAGAVLAIQTEHVALSRAECVSLYRHYVGDQWTAYVEQVCALRTPQRGYALPTDPAERAHLRHLCAQLPAFANHFLMRHRAHVLAQLDGGAETEVWWAIQALTEVAYPEPGVRQALERLWERETDRRRRDVLQKARALQGANAMRCTAESEGE